MPELPEVEVSAQSLRPVITGGQLLAWSFSGKRLRHPFPKTSLQSLVGKVLLSVGRRAKYVLLEFEEGWLAIHLGMSGSLQCVPESHPRQTHDHVRLMFDGHGHRTDVVFHDPRRFGSFQWIARQPVGHGDIACFLGESAAGMEPLSVAFTGDVLFRQSRKRATPVKHWLMTGKVVVGVGNIYACEALFAAGIHPKRKAGALTRAACQALASAIQQILANAIAQGGSTIADFVAPNGQAGRYGQAHQVYGREGQPCPRCGGSGMRIRRIVQQGRSTFYCHGCQR